MFFSGMAASERSFPLANSAGLLCTVDKYRTPFPKVATMSALMYLGAKPFFLQLLDNTKIRNFVDFQEKSQQVTFEVLNSQMSVYPVVFSFLNPP